MNQFSVEHYSKSAFFALASSTMIVALLFGAFFFAEPSISHGQVDTSNDFTIKQVITDETSFLVQPTNVTTSGSINGVSGGNASGTTQFAVISNNSSGYYVEITFENNGFGAAMIGDANSSAAIRDYDGDAAGPQPSYGYTASSAAQFAYTVSSDTISDTAQSFLNDGGSTCNEPAGAANGTTKATKCWKAPSFTGFEIVNRSNAAVTGATSTLEFDITVPSSAFPVPEAQTYTATATLTLFTQ